jgi:hypothetical protein
MSVAGTTASGSLVAPRKPLDPPHVHVWELRAVEFDSWGEVSLYECLSCPRVRYG